MTHLENHVYGTWVVQVPFAVQDKLECSEFPIEDTDDTLEWMLEMSQRLSVV